jgi:hypothetical protein
MASEHAVHRGVEVAHDEAGPEVAAAFEQHAGLGQQLALGRNSGHPLADLAGAGALELLGEGAGGGGGGQAPAHQAVGQVGEGRISGLEPGEHRGGAGGHFGLRIQAFQHLATAEVGVLGEPIGEGEGVHGRRRTPGHPAGSRL